MAEGEVQAVIHRRLYEKGWIAPTWPPEHGGTGWTVRQRTCSENELAVRRTDRQVCMPRLHQRLQRGDPNLLERTPIGNPHDHSIGGAAPYEKRRP